MFETDALVIIGGVIVVAIAIKIFKSYIHHGEKGDEQQDANGTEVPGKV